MFPDAEFLGLDLYVWMFIVGVLAAMSAARLCSARAGLCTKVFNIVIVSAVSGVILGYVFAVLTQSFWEFLESGTFVWGAGATFYGGLIGAAIVYLAVYFILGKLFCREGEHLREIWNMLSLVAPCIALAHAFGRLGCLFEGCCYGAETDAWYGIEMRIGGVWQRRVPIQLYESLFLFALSAAMFLLLLRRKGTYNFSLYLVLYGIWRFLIEFARADDRGSSGVGALTPSQLLSILLTAVGIGLWAFCFFQRRRTAKERHESP